jgi:biotin synthase-related radical SAM superfamily protein
MKPSEAEKTISFLIKNDMVATFFDPKKHEQMIGITERGKEIHEILMHMIKTDNMEKLVNPCESNKSFDGYHSYLESVCIFCGEQNK